MRTPDPLSLSLPEAFALACQAAGPLRVRAAHRPTGVEEGHTVHSPFVFLGRSVSAGVRLNDPTVSQCHAYLQVVEGALYCTDLGSRTGVVWEDGTQGRGWVGPDQTLRVGAFDVRVEGVGAPPEAPPDEQDPGRTALTPAAVEVHTAAGPGGAHPLDRPITLVGRNPACDLRLLDDSIAYFQCALVNTTDGVWFVDTMTRHAGTLNGRGTRLSRVRDGDLLELGRVSLLLRVGAHHGSRLAVRPPAPPAPAGLDPVAVISGKIAESVSGAVAPVAEVTKQFQNCFLTMARMFASMHQEQAALVREQMRQIQELAAELRELRGEGKAGPPAAAKPAPGPRPGPVPRAPAPAPTPGGADGAAGKPDGDAQPLFDAHEWFLDRLSSREPQPPAT